LASLLVLLGVLACGGKVGVVGDGTAGQAGTGGNGGSAGSGAAGTGGITDCSNVGCAPAPLCDTGCLEPCGCCPCAEGSQEQLQGELRTCVGGCWASSTQLCEYGGATHLIGETFNQGDGCNTCICNSATEFSCTKSICLCDPATETYRRKYLYTSPQLCAGADFLCPLNTSYFSNQCGCGCEQSPSCPETIGCMPTTDAPGSCDVLLIARCPYSVIAL